MAVNRRRDEMDRDSNLSVDVRDFLAVSARYLGIEDDIPVASSDRIIPQAGERLVLDPSPYRCQALVQRCA